MSLADRLHKIQERIAHSAELAGRDPSSVTLVAVTKTVEAGLIREAYDLGLRDFGESRLQEAIPKIVVLPKDIVWHFIGKLQSNKVKKAAEYFHVLHTLESESQLNELAKTARMLDALIEVNIANEPQKSGIPPDSVDAFWKKALQCSQVRLRGLMTIGPVNPNSENLRPYYQAMRKLLEGVHGEWLSMGMSNDFDVAIQEGATHVRIGSALFGQRNN